MPDAVKLLNELTAARQRLTRATGRHASPFPGLTAFQEADADRYFGRERETAAARARLVDEPILLLAGPSGIGKSSFVRAGLVPALKHQAAWHAIVARPGRSPMANLVAAVLPVLQQLQPNVELPTAESLAERLVHEPGLAGAMVRRAAQHRGHKVLVFLDQFEEAFTLNDAEAAGQYLRVLQGLADDASSPLRLVVAMRSDFLDRLSEFPAFAGACRQGLMFLHPLDEFGVRDALEMPLAQVGYAFESLETLEEMARELAHVAGALPLMQFTASMLWERRNTETQQLPVRAYHELGGVAGALAMHAEAVVKELTPAQVQLMPKVALRLVTPEGTRAVVERHELRALGDALAVDAIIDKLVAARLLVTDAGEHDATQAHAKIELVHESLIAHWPSLRRWREHDQDIAALLHELRPVARQWDTRGRPIELLWTGALAKDAQRLAQDARSTLAPIEQAFVDATLAQGVRRARRRKLLLGAAASAIIALFVVGAMVLVTVRAAERQAARAREVAEREAQRAQVAESAARERLAEVEAAQARRVAAEAAARDAAAQKAAATASLASAQSQVAAQDQELEFKNRKLLTALANAERATVQAQAASKALERALAQEKQRNEELQRRSKGLVKDLR